MNIKYELRKFTKLQKNTKLRIKVNKKQRIKM